MTSRAARLRMAPQRVHEFLTELFADDMHAARVLSLGNAVSGTIQAAALSVHAIGRGLALANQLEVKSAIKQVDRLLSNMKLSVWELFPVWVAYLLSERSEVVLALDWTEFDKDGHATIALNMLTRHGRATPLMWKTHEKSALAKHRNDFEDELLGRFRAIVPSQVKVTILADRGFGDQALYKALLGANMDFVIRFRSRILVTDAQGDTFAAEALVPGNGRAKKYSNVRVTDDKSPVPAVVCVRAKNMQEAWCLATSRDDLAAGEIVSLYGRRFTIEENFRDTKDPRFGLGLSATRVGRTDRRDRLLLIAALAQALLTLLGAASEDTGLDRTLKANTVKHRTMSLFNQGWFWYQAIPGMREERLLTLMEAFGRIVSQRAVCREVFGVI
jgi:hypothetical protein